VIPTDQLVFQGGATWAVLILPWMEQDNLYRRWDLGQTYYDQTPVARQTNVKSYFCPSRRSSDSSPNLSVSGDVPPINNVGYQHQPGGLADYAVVVDKSGHDAPEET
jgi:hypothetical protein